MSKTFLKYLFSLSLLLIVGNQQVLGYTLDYDTVYASAISQYTTQNGGLENVDEAGSLVASSFSATKQHLLFGEENLEEEEKYTVFLNKAVTRDFLLASFFLAPSFIFFKYHSKKDFTYYFHFSYLPTSRRHLLFEVFRI
jgi:hypothetical protein